MNPKDVVRDAQDLPQPDYERDALLKIQYGPLADDVSVEREFRRVILEHQRRAIVGALEVDRHRDTAVAQPLSQLKFALSELLDLLTIGRRCRRGRRRGDGGRNRTCTG